MLRWLDSLRQREDRILLILSLVVGVLTGLAVVAFILLTERLGLRLYPVGSAAWRRVLIPMAGSLAHGLPALAVFSRCAGQWRAADQSGAVCARRCDHRLHDARQIFLHRCNARERHPTGTRRTFRTSGRGNRIGSRSEAWATTGKREGADSHWRGCSHRRGVQHASGGRAFFARRNHGRPERASAGLRSAGVGDIVAGAAATARQ